MKKIITLTTLFIFSIIYLPKINGNKVLKEVKLYSQSKTVQEGHIFVYYLNKKNEKKGVKFLPICVLDKDDNDWYGDTTDEQGYAYSALPIGKVTIYIPNDISHLSFFHTFEVKENTCYDIEINLPKREAKVEKSLW